MLKSLITKVFGTRFDREVKKVQPLVDAIKRQEAALADFTEDQLKAQTPRFRALLAERTGAMKTELDAVRQARHDCADPAERDALEDRYHDLELRYKKALAAALNEILPEAFATVREACRRLVGTTVLVTGRELTWDMVPYDVQLIGGIVLHQGRIAEMATGEGKTLVATLPLYLNALAGRGAHLVTVNNYLARRDSQWMGHVYRYLGLTVGCLDDTEPSSPERRAAYNADITYGTNNEFGFDYLRDNMVFSLEQRVQREHAYAIVDEIDSILIDEARTPLIISGPVGNENDDKYAQHNRQVVELVRRQTAVVNTMLAEGEPLLADPKTLAEGARKLYVARLGMPKNKKLLKLLNEPGVKSAVQRVELDHIADRKLPMRQQAMRELEESLFFVLDEKGHSVHLTDQGAVAMSPNDPGLFVVPDISEAVHAIDRDTSLPPDQRVLRRREVEAEYALKSEKLHIIHKLLQAHALYEKEVDYLVQDGQVVIVDEFTGRVMAGRRWADGLHQAVEAKEGVQVKGETQTLATITIQNYFRMYDKLSGMTGTAETEEQEFFTIYGLEVSVIPTNRPIRRSDEEDRIYKTRREKTNAIADEVERIHAAGLPVLIGTVTVEVSETLSRQLKRRGLKHEVLNAKYHQREAEIVAQAGQRGAITIATNMAGRGTDIKLGADVTKVESTDGLQIIGTERHESRRIDRQLRGRSGRQGDPGRSLFFLSLEDDLMRLFGTDRIAGWMDKGGAEEGEVISHPWVTGAISQAQKRVELQNFQARKRLLEYDDVMNQQREVVYSLRLFALERGEQLKAEATRMVDQAMDRVVTLMLADAEKPEDYDREGLRAALLQQFLVQADEVTDAARAGTLDQIRGLARAAGHEAFRRKIEYLLDFGRQLGAPDVDSQVLSTVMLTVLDEKWKDHLYDLDQLRNAIQYRAYGQKDPLVEYKKEAFEMFEDLMRDVHASFTERFLKIQITAEPPRPQAPPPPAAAAPRRPPAPSAGADDMFAPDAREAPPAPPPQVGPRLPAPPPMTTNRGPLAPARAGTETVAEVGRNDPCPCGSGKKYKKCHGVGK
ncbi:MAG: preprotein translocase subunit SecA [Gemmatimonadetes bacterium]|nr:preprotein translocase subunit SecA [Gemmatimonadota bacterium]MBP6668388.1 preprotein translocase subunit SecA [Gemmatimonadales bacterium]